MNLQKFKEVYMKVIHESTDDSELKQYIRTIVEELLFEERGPIDGKDPKIRINKKNYPKLYAAITDIQDPVYAGYPIFHYYVDDEVPYDEAKFRAELDRLENILGTKDGLQNKEIKKFLKGYAPTPRPDLDVRSRSKGPELDDDGYPKSTPYGWKPKNQRSPEDDWLH